MVALDKSGVVAEEPVGAEPVDAQLAEDQLAEDQLAEDQLAEDQLAEDQPAEDQLAEDQLAEDQLAEDQPAEEPQYRNLGTWALIGFEDPVAVSLQQHGEKIGGRGCLIGNPSVTLYPDFCGELSGTIRDRDIEFSFPFHDAGEKITYGSTARISEDLTRMTGRLDLKAGSTSNRLAWLPIDEHASWLEGDQNDIFEGFYRPGTDFEVVAGPEDSDEFSYGVAYKIGFAEDRSQMFGALGAFHHSEMTVPPGKDAPILVGPVSATTDGLAVEVEIRLKEGVPHELFATTTSGSSFLFRAIAAKPSQ